MPFEPVTKKLQNNQFAVKLGEKLFPQDSPSLSVQSKGDGLYELAFKVLVKASVEIPTGATEAPLPLGTFAVLNQGNDQLMSSNRAGIFFTAESDQAGSGFSLRFSGDFDPPGSKGDHGN